MCDAQLPVVESRRDNSALTKKRDRIRPDLWGLGGGLPSDARTFVHVDGEHAPHTRSCG